MRLRLVNNSEVIIQARNESDFQKAMKVADNMCALSDDALVVCSYCTYEYWVHLTGVAFNYQAADFKHYYKEAKASVGK